jgi:hypothetical protein
MKTPFDIVTCSWPRPAEVVNGRWVFEPEWNGPPMPTRPESYWTTLHSEPYWTINWREFFRTGVKPYHPSLGGEMRGFYVVFDLQVKESGKLVFWADDECAIRRNGQVIYQGRDTHTPTRGEVEVGAGDYLQVAQWQGTGEWLWGARVVKSGHTVGPSPDNLLRLYLSPVRERLAHPGGPPLKMYLSGIEPVRTIVALYSMNLNGYSPSKVVLFGEHQWDQWVRELFAAAFPFAEVVPTERLLKHFQELGGSQLSEMAQEDYFVMKPLIALLFGPRVPKGLLFGYLGV